MSSVESLEIIAERLNAYHGQLTALAQALGALQAVSDHMIAALASDHAAILTHVAAAAAPQAHAADVVIARVADALEPQPVEIDPIENLADAPVLLPAEVAAEGQTEAETETATETETVAETVTTLVCDTAETAEAAVESGTSAATECKADQAIEPVAVAGVAAEETGVATAAGDGKVVNLASRRRALLDKFPARRAMAVVASIAVTVTAGMGFHELMQTELGQRLLDLGTCDGDMLSANRDCALLAWLML